MIEKHKISGFGKNNFIVNLDENEVIYRAEGNANIVLSLRHIRMVLRIRKSFISEKKTEAQSDEELERSIEYTKYLSSLVGFSFSCSPKFVYLKVSDLNMLNKDILEFRPVDRLEKEVRTRIGSLYPDVAFLPSPLNTYGLKQDFNPSSDVYCVEIKPKQGWTFFDDDPDNIAENNQNYFLHFDDFKKCRYCSFQYLKLKKSVINKVSKYCPLDLFSGQNIRMLRAIKGLIGSPQNNLRVFKNGKLVYGNNIEKRSLNLTLEDLFYDYKTNDERKTVFINLIKEFLLKEFDSDCDMMVNRDAIKLRKDRKKNKNTIHKRNCEPIKYKYLPEKCALKKILNIQLLVKYSVGKLNTEDLYEPEKDEYDYIEPLLKKVSMSSLDCHQEISQTSSSMKMDSKYCKTCVDEHLNTLTTLQRYMLGATALDCSLMITFRRISQEEIYRLDEKARNHVVQLRNMWFIVNITIMDLDPKSLKHFIKYVEQINNSYVAYKEFLRKF